MCGGAAAGGGRGVMFECLMYVRLLTCLQSSHLPFLCIVQRHNAPVN